ncbi:pyruvate kinase [Leptinotarsa decemlineata]|uniref:pyruvate kinase n=1 Tax=Leptinotarsa decemlineata TaxID=7539 RepID=UPI003D3081C0
MDYRAHCPKLPWMIDFHSNEEKDVLNTQYQAAFADTSLKYLSSLNVKSKPSRFRSTQLIASIPANVTCNNIDDMLTAGMRVARITGTKLEKIKETLSKVRVINENFSRRLGRVYPLGIAMEISGPEIRIGNLKGSAKKLYLQKGKFTKLTTEPSYEDFVTEDMIYIDYEKLPEVVQPGDKVILDNGSVTLTALECVESIINCIVDKAGVLLSHASVVVPNAPIELPQISANDKELMGVAIGECVDFLFISGIYNKEGIMDVRDLLGQGGETIQIVAKIGVSAAIANIDEIIEASDAICIDCERLMVELPKEKVFLVQKSILAKCNIAGKPAISTIHIADSKTVSKSEISDIANAIIDGSDALLLAREACTKKILSTVNNICKEAEPAVHQKQVFNELIGSISSPMEAIYSLGISVVEAASKTNAAAIICLTSSGRTAKILARFRPRCPVIAVTRYGRIGRMLGIYKAMEPIIYLRPFNQNWTKDVDDRIQLGVTYGKYVGYIRMGDALITVTPSRPDCGMANTMKVIYASDFDALPKKKPF